MAGQPQSVCYASGYVRSARRDLAPQQAGIKDQRPPACFAVLWDSPFHGTWMAAAPALRAGAAFMRR